MLLSLDTTKSNGPDSLSALMLKATATSIAPGITKLFNKSMQSGTVPEAWKISSVVPIPKGSKPASVSNTRICIIYSSKFCISTFYRPPNSDVSYFDELYDIIEKLDL